MIRNRKLILPFGILFAVIGLFLVVFLVRASADDMLHQAARLMADAADGHAVATFSVDMPEKSGDGTVEVWGKKDVGPEGEPALRIEVIESSEADMAGVVAVSDGVQFWLWKPAENVVYTGTAAEMKTMMQERMAAHEHDGDHEAAHADADFPETPEEAVDKLLEYFTAERAGASDIGGAPAEQIRLIPIPEKMPDEVRANGGLLNVWLRNGDNAPLGIEYTGGAVGYGKATATLLELNIGVDEALFTFEIPPGAEVVNVAELAPEAVTLDEAAAASDFVLLTPDSLAVPARLVDVVEVRGAVVQQYRLPDGGRFTIAQGAAEAGETPAEDGEAVTVRGLPGMLYSDAEGARTLLTWDENNVKVWIGGDLTADQALTLAESLQ